MSEDAGVAAANSLGLDLDGLRLDDKRIEPESTRAEDTEASPVPDAGASPGIQETAEDEKDEQDKSVEDEGKKSGAKEKKQPYINPERVKTGGAQRDKLSDEELAARMVRIREQNEKIKLRRMDVQKDEDEFRKMQEAERIKVAKTKKVQEHVDRTREQNARRKLDKIESREWDSGKPKSHWKDNKKTEDSAGDDSARSPRARIGIRGAVRGGSAQRGRNKGAPAGANDEEQSNEASNEAAPTPSVESEWTW